MPAGRRKLGNRYAVSNIPGVSYLWVVVGNIEHVVLVDTVDVPRLRAHTWGRLRQYVATRVGPERRVLYLHRHLLDAQAGVRVTFKDGVEGVGVPTNYTRENLSAKKTGRTTNRD